MLTEEERRRVFAVIDRMPSDGEWRRLFRALDEHEELRQSMQAIAAAQEANRRQMVLNQRQMVLNSIGVVLSLSALAVAVIRAFIG